MFHGERMGVVKGGRVGRVVARPIVATMLGRGSAKEACQSCST